MKRFDQINVIPFIDIMLVLLAIVLTTATFIVQGDIPVRLSDAESAQQTEPADPVNITINREGVVRLGKEAISVDVLSEQLKGLPVTTPVRVQVDSETPFNHFVAVVDELNALGLEQLSITTNLAQ